MAVKMQGKAGCHGMLILLALLPTLDKAVQVLDVPSQLSLSEAH
jgi:hypothetical protein